MAPSSLPLFQTVSTQAIAKAFPVTDNVALYEPGSLPDAKIMEAMLNCKRLGRAEPTPSPSSVFHWPGVCRSPEHAGVLRPVDAISVGRACAECTRPVHAGFQTSIKNKELTSTSLHIA